MDPLIIAPLYNNIHIMAVDNLLTSGMLRHLHNLLLFLLLCPTFVTSRPPAHLDLTFPAPPTQISWSTAYSLARNASSTLNFFQKQSLTYGTGLNQGPCSGNLAAEIPSINLPRLCLNDGPVGVRGRGVDLVTVFPAGVTTASTFDRELMYLRSRAMGSEYRLKGVNVALAPFSGALGRAPAAGRNWEGFGPDPYLAGIGTGESVKGLQDSGVIACAKHWIANEQERYRLVMETLLSLTTPPITQSLSSEVGDRALKELYEWPFVDAVHAGVGSVMCAYQRVNGIYSCESIDLLRNRLKGSEEKGGLGFKGFVMTDWLAAAGATKAAEAGVDMVMPGDAGLVGLAAGGMPASDGAGVSGESRLDEMVVRVLAAWYKLGQDKGDYPTPNFSAWSSDDFGIFADRGYIGRINHHIEASQALHAQVAKRVAEEGIVLLKNSQEGGKGLPLQGDQIKKIGVFGSDAGPIPGGPNNCGGLHACSNGTLAVGWGSGTGTFKYLIDPLQAIKEKANQIGASVTSILDDYAYPAISSAAASQDACLVFINSRSGEGMLEKVGGTVGDRNNLTAWRDGDTLVQTVASSCPNTIVTIHSVGPILMEPWISHPNVTAILLAHLPGQESGNSLVSVLWGDVNPSGKLPYTIAKRAEDYCCRVQYEWTGFAPKQEFKEKGLIDYMWFEKNQIEPRFEFGFGLSYTKFSPVSGSLALVNPQSPADSTGFHDEIAKLRFRIRNTGEIFGKVVVELYVRFPESVSGLPDSPVKVLRGFDKIGLEAGVGGEVEFSVRKRDVSWWNVTAQKWEVVKGSEYTFMVGESVSKIWEELKVTFS